MRSISEIRKEIDAVDGELVRLLARRIQLAREVAEIKVSESSNLVDLMREDEIIEKVRKLASELNVNPDHLEALFRIIMLVCLKEEVIHVEKRGDLRGRR